MLEPSFEYEGVRRVAYDGGASFVPVCEKCGRFVKADENIRLNHESQLLTPPNATCSKCGRTTMIFEGFI